MRIQSFIGFIFKIYQKILDKAYKGGAVNNKLVSKMGRKIHSSIKPEHIQKFGYKLKNTQGQSFDL